MNTMTRRSTRWRRATWVAAGIMAVSTMAAACGGDEGSDPEVASLGTATDSSDGGSATESTVDREEAMLDYAQCMRDHGIDMPDPKVNSNGGVAIQIEPGAEQADVEAAEKECQPLMEDALGEIEIDPEKRAEMQEKMLDYAQCMRDHGIDMPDPQFDENGGMRIHTSGDDSGAPRSSAAPGPMIDEPDFMDDPGFEEADEACADEAGMKMRPAQQVSESGGEGH